ncbi:unnamed protein product, partial [Notodromas monacha]
MQIRSDSLVILAVDRSGSTQNAQSYWKAVKQKFTQIINMDPCAEILYIVWDTMAVQVTEENFLKCVESMDGVGGTCLASLCQFLSRFLRSNETKPVHLHICTDGQISTEDVHYSDSLLANVEFHTVDVCIEQTSHLGVDVSVAIPFLRNSKYTVTANGTLAMQGNSKIPLYPIIKTLEDFLHVKDELWHRYYPKFVGLQHLTPELQHFKSWLITTKKECIKAAAPRGIHKLLRLLQDGKEDEAVDILRLGKPCDDPSPEESIEAHFAPLVNLTSQIKFPLATYLKYPVSRVARRPNADFIQKVDLWGDFNTGESLETLCNITGEMDIPVLMIRKCDAGLFNSLEPACIDYMVTMPLDTLLSSKACNKLASILDFPIGYKAYFQWVHTGGHNTSPYTRESIVGCIPISSHPKLIAYSNNMISHLFWGGKKVGTPVLWMWVLYFVIQEHKACEYLRSSHQDFIKVFLKVIVKRSCEEMTRLGMSGLGNFPATPVPVKELIHGAKQAIGETIGHTSLPDTMGHFEHVLNHLPVDEE